MTEKVTRYMHTLDGRPASVQRDENGTWMFFVGGRDKATLADTLWQVRREQNACLETLIARQRYDSMAIHEEVGRYGYVLVEVEVA